MPVSSTRPQAIATLLLAVLVLLLAGCAPTPAVRTERVLEQVPRAALDANEVLAAQLRAAQLALTELRPNAALEALSESPGADTPVSLLLAYHQLRANAYELSGDHVAGARERVWMDPLLTDPDKRYANQARIWETLSRLSDVDLERVYRSGRRDALYGWMELVRLSREYRHRPEQLSRAITRWDRRYPGHPANEGLLREMLEQARQTRETSQSLRQVALLLPLTGPLAHAGIAVRDGFLAANFHQPRGVRRPAIRVYDVGAGPRMVTHQYHRAVEDGAEFVVGPLDRAAVDELGRISRLAVPVLALNYLDHGRWSSKSFYQFGLSPEDEARHVAWQARLDDHQRALALVPEGPWGERVLRAFQEQWAALGGELLQSQTYDPAKTDFAVPIGELLNLSGSRERQRDLRSLLNRTLKFEPRRRQDVDFIFLVGLPPQARLLGPQLRFHQAARVPVYSTSHLYTGIPDPEVNRDLDGIRFCDMPWLLETGGGWQAVRDELLETASREQKRHTRLYALGVDAYNVLPYLDKLGDGAFSRFNGVTGNLYLDSKRRLHRELVWAQFRKGTARLLRPGGSG